MDFNLLCFKINKYPEDWEVNDNDPNEKNICLQIINENDNYFYVIDEKGSKIGRHSTNNIKLNDESVSRYHAEIRFNNNKFYIHDLGSLTGTYIKMKNLLNLTSETIFQMGYNIFKSEILNDNEMNLLILEGQNEGKNNFNNIYIKDENLSNYHARIYKNVKENKFFLEDLQSKNGIWIRISSESKFKSYCLDNSSIFKIGYSLFIVKNEKNNNENNVFNIQYKENENNLCGNCFLFERDVIFIPCKHFWACVDCSYKIKNCPICKCEIVTITKIYN